MGHLSSKYLKIIISSNYDLKTYFSEGLIFEDLWTMNNLKVVQKKAFVKTGF